MLFEDRLSGESAAAAMVAALTISGVRFWTARGVSS